MTNITFNRVKVITSHAGYARFLAECTKRTAGWLPRCAIANVPSPYAYSPVRVVENWKGRKVFVSETRHKRFEVFEVPADMPVFAKADDAENYNFAQASAA